MKKELLFSIGGGVIGSLIEEGIEGFFPGVGELGLSGEIAGAITGLLSSKVTKEDVKDSVEKFIKYAYKSINTKEADELSDEEAELFNRKFQDIPKAEKKKILNNFKNLAPYEYDLIKEFLKGLEGA